MSGPGYEYTKHWGSSRDQERHGPTLLEHTVREQTDNDQLDKNTQLQTNKCNDVLRQRRMQRRPYLNWGSGKASLMR